MMRTVRVVALLALAACSVVDAFVSSSLSPSRSFAVVRSSNGVALAAAAPKKKAAAAPKKAAAAPAKKKKADAPPVFRKGDFINSIVEKTGLSKTDSEAALAAVLETISEALVNGFKVSMLGFGSFKVTYRAARKGRNPQTGEEIQISESFAPSFTAGKGLKDKLNPDRK